MMTSWQRAKFLDITDKIGSGATPRGGKKSYKNEGISLIRSMNVYDFYFDYDELAYIDDNQANLLANVEVHKNDILLNITGASVARCCMVPQKILPSRVNQHVAIVRVNNKKADPFYVQYTINSPLYKQSLLNLAQGGATREALTKSTIENFEIPLPPLPTQRKISAILSAYDDLIENNTRRIRILEEMAQRIYREWFVHFRYPGHENQKMIESELGLIPEGWEAQKIGDLLEKISRKKRIKKQDYEEQGPVPVVDQSRDFIGGYTSDLDAQHIDPLPIIIFGDHTRVLKYINFPFACGADGTQLLISNTDRLPPALFFYTLKAIDLSDYAYARHFKFLKEQKVIAPKQDIAIHFSDLVNKIHEEISYLRDMNNILRQTCNLLLPKLISGKIDVSDLDIDVGAIDA